ncbi:hypothetical protein [Solirubrum puertoriconensis]|uniref:STAS/SEC14 domain-containing protein n=1 Tax=Solirubrum puertoriconensis TaxID=1751427 RepID=A0A9X0L534_SOLP1|nr:hypothetical protein [Solirubrum puertoriconensis]KUG08145.1 hypothetical protein ASU33_08090 [Solirubrum puertoriconensis]
MAVVHKSAALIIHYHAATAVLEAEWLGFVSSEQLRSGLQELLRHGRLRRVRGWIANHKQMRTIRLDDQEWMLEQFIPRVAELPLVRLGLVYSDDPLNRMAIKRVISSGSKMLPCQIEFFSETQQAQQWVGEGATNALPQL